MIHVSDSQIGPHTVEVLLAEILTIFHFTFNFSHLQNQIVAMKC